MIVSGYYYDPKHDTNDEKSWSAMDVEDLQAALAQGSTIEEAAQHLCRAGTIEEVRAKATELGFKYRRATTALSRWGKKSTRRKLPDEKRTLHRWKGRLVPDKVTRG